jgi:hypothetical protein
MPEPQILPDGETTFETDPAAFRDVAAMLLDADTDGLDTALGVVAGALAAILSYLVDAFGRAEAKVIVTGAVERYFARLTQ